MHGLPLSSKKESQDHLAWLKFILLFIEHQSFLHTKVTKKHKFNLKVVVLMNIYNTVNTRAQIYTFIFVLDL